MVVVSWVVFGQFFKISFPSVFVSTTSLFALFLGVVVRLLIVTQEPELKQQNYNTLDTDVDDFLSELEALTGEVLRSPKRDTVTDDKHVCCALVVFGVCDVGCCAVLYLFS